MKSKANIMRESRVIASIFHLWKQRKLRAHGGTAATVSTSFLWRQSGLCWTAMKSLRQACRSLLWSWPEIVVVARSGRRSRGYKLYCQVISRRARRGGRAYSEVVNALLRQKCVGASRAKLTAPLLTILQALQKSSLAWSERVSKRAYKGEHGWKRPWHRAWSMKQVSMYI